MNNAEYDQRLAFVSKAVQQHLNVETGDVSPIAYDSECPFPYNNFVYRVAIPPSQSQAKAQAGVVPVPSSTSSVVIRLSNPKADGLNNANRIENEVAAMSLMRDALQSLAAPLVPDVYGWRSMSPGEQGWGWIMQQDMPGVLPPSQFDKMSSEDKKAMIEQVAEIFALLQRYPLPKTLTDYGGMSFSPSGDIVSDQMTLIKGGPFSSYEALVRETFRQKLLDADAHETVRGWRRGGVREALDGFLANDAGDMLKRIEPGRVLVHGDLTLNNVLWKPETKQITALLDFDWAQINHPGAEFLSGFIDFYGQLPGPDPEEDQPLREAFLEGFPNPLPPSTEELNWETAAAWDAELASRKVQIPRTIKGMRTLSDLAWLSGAICPFRIFNKTVKSNYTPERMEELVKDWEKVLLGFLEKHDAK